MSSPLLTHEVTAGTARRLYYDEPGVTEFDSTVTAIRELARVNGRQVWQIALDHTAFYPTGGGQPCDTGVLVATARSGAVLEVPVTAVDEDDAGEVWHTTDKPLQEGTAVQGRIDRQRRHDHMQQHSGQHLLSAILRREFGAKTVSFHMGAETSTIDMAGLTPSGEALAQAERAANEAVQSALPVTVRYASHAEAEQMLADGLLPKLPPRSGNIRLIEIAGLDLNACGGTHVGNTAAIGPVLLRGTERVRDTLRVSFLCGNRALHAARATFQQIDSLAASLSTSTEDVATSVARLQAESRTAAKERELLLRRLASAEAVPLAAASQQAGNTFVIHTLNPQEPGCSASYAKLLAISLLSSGSIRSAVVAAPEGERCSVVLASGDTSLDCGSTLRNLLQGFGGRGGGSHDMAQGSLPASELNGFLKRLAGQLSA